MMNKRDGTVAVVALGLCVFVSSLNWMYMRIPQYLLKAETGSDLTGWLLSGYIIAEVATVIIAGTIIDRLGPRNAVLIGTSVFFGSSIGLCLCEGIEMMIAFRIVQGIGAGFLFTTALSFIGKVFPRSKRLDPHKIMTLTFSLGSIFGTAVGYYFGLEQGNWKILVPVSAFAVLICGTVAYRKLPEIPRDYVRDVPGLILTFVSIAAVMTYTQMMSESFDLLSWESLAFAEFCIVLVFLLIWVEKRAKDPIIPHGITRNDIGLLSGMFLVGFCGIGLIQFITMFMMVSYGLTLYEASKMLFCLIAGGVVTSLMGMKMVYKEGIRPLTLVGSFIVMIAFIGAYFLMPRGIAGVGFSLFTMGLGFGLIVTEMVTSLQAVTPTKHQGALTGMLMSARFVGIILGMAVYNGIVRKSIGEYIQTVEGEAVGDVTTWLLEHMHEYLDELIALFGSTVRECCIAGGIAVISAWIICYFMVDRKDLDAPEWVEDWESDLPAPAGLAPHRGGDQGADDEGVDEDAQRQGEAQLREHLDPREEERSEAHREDHRGHDDDGLETGHQIRRRLLPCHPVPPAPDYVLLLDHVEPYPQRDAHREHGHLDGQGQASPDAPHQDIRGA